MDSEGKLHLTKLVAFYNVIISWVDKGRAVDVAYPDFSKTFDTVSCSILLGMVRKYRLDK